MIMNQDEMALQICRLGLPGRYFLSLGRMVPKKNLRVLVEAYRRLVQGWGEAEEVPTLVFVGSGEEEEKLEEQARALGLEVVDRRDAGVSESRHAIPVIRHKENCGAVFFYGFRQVEENPVFYALAEAFILPSLYEEWGLVVNEAMACGLPVIVSRTAGCAGDLVPVRGQVTSDEWRVASDGAPEASLSLRPSIINSLEQRSNGFVFDPESVEALATAMGKLAGDEGLRRRMGTTSREIIAGWGCDNFARQALCAARAAKGE